MSAIRKFTRNSTLRRGISSLLPPKRELSSQQDFIVKSNYGEVEVPRVPVMDLVFKHTDKWNHKVAIECGVTGRKYTYEELRTYADNFHRALRTRLKLKVGDVVAVMMPNVPEYPIATFGILKACMIVTTINPIYTEDEIARQLSDSGAKLIITLGSFTNSAKAAISKIKKNIQIIGITTQRGESLEEEIINFQELIGTKWNGNGDAVKDVDSLTLLPYSSGTTGLPKGVELTNQNLVANLMQCTVPELETFYYAEGDHQDCTIAILPMFHIYGIESLLWYLHFGCKVITLPRFTPESYATALLTHKPEVLFLVPPIIIYLNVFPGITTDHLRSLRMINSGAAPLGALDEHKLKEKAQKDIDVRQGYGLSEAPVVTVAGKLTKVAGSVGDPVASTMVKVVALDDPTETPLGPNQTGELYVKGPQVMRGYFNRPEETKNAFSDGWFKTGDMVYYNEEKQFFVTDRIKELVKVKGFQVPPAELEEVIRDFKGVDDACVIGVPHELHGEVPRAYVVASKGETIDINKLDEFVASKVASYKKLEGGIAVVDAIPKNASGKLLRRQLKQLYMDEKK